MNTKQEIEVQRPAAIDFGVLECREINRLWELHTFDFEGTYIEVLKTDRQFCRNIRKLNYKWSNIFGNLCKNYEQDQ